MFLYRGQDIGDRYKLTDTCLKIIEEGLVEKILDILPHIRVLRSAQFFPPLLELLKEGNHQQQEAAMAALGSLGDEMAIGPLREVYFSIRGRKTTDASSLEASVISALGEIPKPASVDVLVEILEDDNSDRDSDEERTRGIISALGQLAQQEVGTAETQLIRFMADSDSASRSLAITELSLAYWHRPARISSTLLQQIFDLTGDPSEEVSTAALAALRSLAQLGCQKAKVLFGQIEQATKAWSPAG